MNHYNSNHYMQQQQFRHFLLHGLLLMIVQFVVFDERCFTHPPKFAIHLLALVAINDVHDN